MNVKSQIGMRSRAKIVPMKYQINEYAMHTMQIIYKMKQKETQHKSPNEKHNATKWNELKETNDWVMSILQVVNV